MPIYLYGVTRGDGGRDPGLIGIDEHKVYTIRYQDIAALVSEIPEMKCEPTIQKVRAYEDVILKVMRDHPIIPMAFGTIAEDEYSISEILDRGYVTFKNVLKKIEQKVQIDVKVSWNLEKLYIDILREDAKIRGLWEEVTRKHKEQSYDERIELGKMIHSALERKKEIYKKEILTTFSDLSGEPPVENKLTSDKMIMNLSFLVNKDVESLFYNKVDELERKYEGRLEILAVGPLPPYNFHRIEIKRMDFESVDAARKVLGLGEEATLDEIEKAHLDLVQRYHPDRNPDPSAEEQFKRVERAYDLLITYCKHFPSPRCSFRKPDVEKTIIIAERR